MSKKQITEKFAKWILFIGAFYFSGTILQNILAVKMIGTPTFNFMDGGVIISWLVFACMDIITEVLGKKKAINYFTFSTILNLFFTGVYVIVILAPGTDEIMSGAISMVLGTNWRITLASVSAFWVGNYINASIMHAMRVNSKNENKTSGFILRAVLSTLFGQLVDNFLFYAMAFGPFGISGTYELEWISIVQNVGITTIVETAFEALMSPLTALFVIYLKKIRDKEVTQNAE